MPFDTGNDSGNVRHVAQVEMLQLLDLVLYLLDYRINLFAKVHDLPVLAPIDETFCNNLVTDRCEPPRMLRVLVRRPVKEETVVVEETGGHEKKSKV